MGRARGGWHLETEGVAKNNAKVMEQDCKNADWKEGVKTSGVREEGDIGEGKEKSLTWVIGREV